MTVTVSFATIQRKSTGEVVAAEYVNDSHDNEIQFNTNVAYFDYFDRVEFNSIGWDCPREAKHHEQESINFELHFIEKEIEL